MQSPPRLKPGQVSLVQADINTGIILKPNGERFLGTGETYLIYDTLVEAETFMKDKMTENRELEFILYDSQGKLIKVTNRLGTKTDSQK